MSTFNFFKNYSKAKGEQFSEGLVNLAASIDAAGVSEAAIKQKQEEHAEYVNQLVEAQVEYRKEKKEFDELFALYTKKMTAAERAQKDLETDPNNTNAQQALVELLDSIEKMAPKLEKEKADYERAERLMSELQQASNTIAQELLGLREQLTAVAQATKDAELQAERAKKEKANAERLAGLTKASNKFDVAMSALQKQAADKQKEADANRIAAEQLRKPVETVSSAAASYMEDEAASAPVESLQDRLARLKSVAK